MGGLGKPLDTAKNSFLQLCGGLNHLRGLSKEILILLRPGRYGFAIVLAVSSRSRHLRGMGHRIVCLESDS